MTERLWEVAPPAPALAAALSIHPVAAACLAARGLDTPSLARPFLARPFSFHSPRDLPGLSLAADLLREAIKTGRKICVWADYDVDGLSGGSTLVRALRLLGVSPLCHVPNRGEDGYGLNARGLKALASCGVSVVVTVDCGIASAREAAQARSLGLSLIITDHHPAKRNPDGTSIIPDADAVAHPSALVGDYPCPHLCGSGVAWKLATALVGAEALAFLPLAALGTVADVVPLTGENRSIVHHGLKALSSSSFSGLKALLEVASLSGKELQSQDIGFQLAPRLNAVGRLGCATPVIDLLTTDDPERAFLLAAHADQANALRKRIEKEAVSQALSRCKPGEAAVIASTDLHSGVAGLVAGRLAEATGMPAIACQLRKQGGKYTVVGSARSAAGVSLPDALNDCSALLQGHGGHAQACGLHMSPANFPAFQGAFREAVTRRLGPSPVVPPLYLDASLSPQEATRELYEALQVLAPFGAGNPEPALLCANVQASGARLMGGDKSHLSFDITSGGTRLRCVAFGKGNRFAEACGPLDVAFTPTLNTWKGRTSVELRVIDFRRVAL